MMKYKYTPYKKYLSMIDYYSNDIINKYTFIMKCMIYNNEFDCNLYKNIINILNNDDDIILDNLLHIIEYRDNIKYKINILEQCIKIINKIIH